jgi:hypothetical protein
MQRSTNTAAPSGVYCLKMLRACNWHSRASAKPARREMTISENRTKFIEPRVTCLCEIVATIR